MPRNKLNTAKSGSREDSDLDRAKVRATDNPMQTMEQPTNPNSEVTIAIEYVSQLCGWRRHRKVVHGDTILLYESGCVCLHIFLCLSAKSVWCVMTVLVAGPQTALEAPSFGMCA